jgi:hypothetical protein
MGQWPVVTKIYGGGITYPLSSDAVMDMETTKII